MTDLFENLLITSPNGKGGIYLFKNKKFFKLDDIGSTGLFYQKSLLLRAVQYNNFISYLKFPFNKNLNNNESLEDIHSVLFFKDYFFIVSTNKNSVYQLDIKGKIKKVWNFPGEEDSWHLNSICAIKGKIFFTAFGEFRKNREYKNNSYKAGFVQELKTGKRIIEDLSQPHSLSFNNKFIFIANSETGHLLKYDLNGKLILKKYFRGYPRGIFIKNKLIYLGISKSRNISHNQIKYAKILVLSADDFCIIDEKKFPGNEIYDLQMITNENDLSLALSSISSNSSLINQEKYEYLHNKFIYLESENEINKKNLIELNDIIRKLEQLSVNSFLLRRIKKFFVK